MKVLVPVKRVLDYNVKARVKPDQSGVDLSNVKMVLETFLCFFKVFYSYGFHYVLFICVSGIPSGIFFTVCFIAIFCALVD